MELKTREQCLALTQDEIDNLTKEECTDAINIFGMDWTDPIYTELCKRYNRCCAIDSINHSYKFTVGQIRNMIKNLNDDDVIQIYDIYNESCFEPFDIFVSKEKDKNNKSHLVFMLDTD